MHHSIYTLGDLCVVRTNLQHYKRLDPRKFHIYDKTKETVVTEYQRMYAIIKARAFARSAWNTALKGLSINYPSELGDDSNVQR
jgi:hypothetical protein